MGEKVLAELLEWLKGAREFVGEHAPDVANQIISRGLWLNGISAVVLLMVSCVCLWVIRFLFNKKWDEPKDEEGAAVVVAALSALTLAGLVGFICTAVKYVIIIVAPKVYILEYLMK